MALAYTRALLKISGEALAGDKGFGLDYHMVEAFAEEIKAVHGLGVHLSLVVGGGNMYFFKSASKAEQLAALRFARWISAPERAAVGTVGVMRS